MPDITPRKDRQSVTRDLDSIQPLLAGVVVKPIKTLEDERGDLVEIYRPDWGIISAPVTSVHQVMIRPKKVKGWSMHKANDDRLFVSMGFVRVALFDGRADSPTHEMLNLFTCSERNRTLIVVPRGVFHAIQNVGEGDAIIISLPTALYDYEDPDKYRLPLKNPLIPFSFDDLPGW